MTDAPSEAALSFARGAVRRAIRAAASGAESAIDEDTLMRAVPLLERGDPGWLRAVLADPDLPLEGRKEIHAHTGEIEAPWNTGEDRT